MPAAKVSSVKPALAGALSFILPTTEQTYLLRACLWPGESGRQAWARWQGHVSDPLGFLRQDDEGFKNLLPLLSVSLSDNGAAVDSAFQTCLRTAYLRDELRSKSYRRICRDVLGAFTAADIPTIVLKGAALADTVYRDPVLQHAHYLELLVKEDELYRAVNLLQSLGFASSNGNLNSNKQHVEIEHQTGLQLVLHHRLFRMPFYNVAAADLWARSEIQTIADVPARIMSPADNLLHVIGQPFCSPNHVLVRWVCDSWFIVHQFPNLDWNILLDCASRAHMALPLYVTLDYLAKDLHAPIPNDFLNRLREIAARTDTIGREAALFGARASVRGGFKTLLTSAGNWRERALIIKWILLPSLRYLQWVQQIRHSWLVPFYYVYRPLRYMTRRIWSFWKGRIRSSGLQKKSIAVLLGTRG